ncbi:MAG: S49 family peptidase, partial [Desulfurellaceae bacterium]|nr:S49 family peptidase [Desulfurellaceae bacterium]
KKLLVRILATIGAWVVVMAIFGLLSSLMSRQHVPDRVVLELDLSQGLVEYLPTNSVTALMFGQTRTTRDVVDALERAAQDERVVGLLARITPAGLGLAQLQEIRDAIRLFRAQGKPALAYADGLGGIGPGNGVYYLATAFDEIYIQPSGGVGLTGLMFESVFFQGTLEKLGIEPRFGVRGKYKNAVNLYTQRQYTPPHKEAVQGLMESQFGQLVDGIAESRSLDQDTVRALMSSGPFLAQDALQAKLVDGLAYRDEVHQTLAERIGQEAERLSLFIYLDRAGRPHTEGDTIALIYGVGTVQSGKTSFDPVFGGPVMGADTVSAAFRRAIDDTEVRAIVFRVDSRGGSPLASDTIWRETMRAKQAGKPVIVSMGNVAGSGGYFVAMAADKIVAQPGTITGSIGVFGQKKSDCRRTRSIPATTPPCGAATWTSVPPSGRSSTSNSTGFITTSRPKWPRAEIWTTSTSCRSPRAASGPARTPRHTGWSTNWAAFRSPCAWPNRRPASLLRLPSRSDSFPASGLLALTSWTVCWAETAKTQPLPLGWPYGPASAPCDPSYI